MASRRRFGWLITATLVAALVLLLAALGLYVLGYLATSEILRTKDFTVRLFRHEWQARLYIPASQAESLIRGEKVTVGYDDGVDAIRPLAAPSG